MTTMVLAGMLFLIGGVAASGIQADLGEEVPISGYSTSGPYVYLFLTGPNIPENGVMLNDVTKRADQGYFTKVSVDGDDHWSYTWNTGSVGGRLDEGTYTVWVVSGPNDLSHLAEADYRTIGVTLGGPSISVDTPAQPGGMDLRSVPDGASLVVNGEYRGKTPLTLSDLSPGTYTVTFSRFGYSNLSLNVPVTQGKIAEVKATLQPESGTLAVNSTPAGANVQFDGTDAGLSPVFVTNISAGNHTVTLVKEGYVSTTRQVSIPAGRAVTVEVSLDTLPVPATTVRSAGILPAMTGAFCVILFSVVWYRRRDQ